MLTDLYNLALAANSLRKNKTLPSRRKVFFAYAKIRLRAAWLRWTAQERFHEFVLGFKIDFFDYAAFCYLFEEIFVSGTYNFRTTNPRPVILDAGSNIGMSVLFIKWLYPEARILAFEPDPQTFEKLALNVRQNHLLGVELFNLALAKDDGTASLHTARSGSLSASLLQERQDASSTAEKSVATAPLSRFIREPIDFLKMDIEGSEAECLREVAESGSFKNIQELVIECHHNLPGRENLLGQTIPLLENAGFRFQIRTITPTTFGSINQAQDVVLHGYRRPAELCPDI